MRNDACAIQLEGTLPAPHAHISVSVERCAYWFRVWYTAKPMDLIAAGLVDNYMQEKIRAQKGGQRSDSNGFLFAVRTGGKGPAHAAWQRGDTVRLYRYPRSNEAALTLPGVRELFPEGIPAWTSTPAETFEKIVSCARDAVDFIRGRDLKPRHRPVGRFQRLVEWTALNNVLYVNWGRIALDREIAQDSRA